MREMSSLSFARKGGLGSAGFGARARERERERREGRGESFVSAGGKKKRRRRCSLFFSFFLSRPPLLRRSPSNHHTHTKESAPALKPVLPHNTCFIFVFIFRSPTTTTNDKEKKKKKKHTQLFFILTTSSQPPLFCPFFCISSIAVPHPLSHLLFLSHTVKGKTAVVSLPFFLQLNRKKRERESVSPLFLI